MCTHGHPHVSTHRPLKTSSNLAVHIHVSPILTCCIVEKPSEVVPRFSLEEERRREERGAPVSTVYISDHAKPRQTCRQKRRKRSVGLYSGCFLFLSWVQLLPCTGRESAFSFFRMVFAYFLDAAVACKSPWVCMLCIVLVGMFHSSCFFCFEFCIYPLFRLSFLFF